MTFKQHPINVMWFKKKALIILSFTSADLVIQLSLTAQQPAMSRDHFTRREQSI